MSIPVNFFRWILYGLTYFLLRIVDFMYDVILKFAGLKLSDFGNWQVFYTIVIHAVGLFIMARIAIIIFKSMVDDSQLHKLGSDFAGRIIQIAIVLGFIPVGLPLLSEFASYTATNLPAMLDLAEVTPSDIILQTGANTDFTNTLSVTGGQNDMTPYQYLQDRFYAVAGMGGNRNVQVCLPIDDDRAICNYDPSSVQRGNGSADRRSIQIVMDENTSFLDIITPTVVNWKASSPGSGISVGDYVYFNDASNLFLMLVLSAILTYCFLVISIQIMSRFVGFIMKVLIAPYVVSGIIDPNDQGVSTWFKLCMGDLLAGFFQIMLVLVAMELTTNLPRSWSAIVKGIAFIGIVFSIIVAPNGIAQLIGQDIGGQSGMMMIQHARTITGLGMAAGHTVLHHGGQLLGGAGQMLGAGTTGAAGLYYGAGRMLGRESLNPLRKTSESGGGNGSNLTSLNSANVADAGVGNESFTPPPMNRQLNTSSNLGFNNEKNTSGGEFTQALNSNGAEQSYMQNVPSPQNVSTQTVSGETNNLNLDPTQSAQSVQSVHSVQSAQNVPPAPVSANSPPMSQIHGSLLYRKAAQRVFTTQRQRAEIRANTTAGQRMSDIAHGINDFLKKD